MAEAACSSFLDFEMHSVMRFKTQGLGCQTLKITVSFQIKSGHSTYVMWYSNKIHSKNWHPHTRFSQELLSFISFSLTLTSFYKLCTGASAICVIYSICDVGQNFYVLLFSETNCYIVSCVYLYSFLLVRVNKKWINFKKNLNRRQLKSPLIGGC